MYAYVYAKSLPIEIRLNTMRRMEQVVFKTKSFAEADQHDVEQHIRLTARERWQFARRLKDRLHPNAKDVRECHKSN